MADNSTFNLIIKDRSEIQKQLDEYYAKGGTVTKLKVGESTATSTGFNNNAYSKGNNKEKETVKTTNTTVVTEKEDNFKPITIGMSVAEEIKREKIEKALSKKQTEPKSKVNPPKVNPPKVDIKKQAEIIAQMRSAKAQATPPSTSIENAPSSKTIEPISTTKLNQTISNTPAPTSDKPSKIKTNKPTQQIISSASERPRAKLKTKAEHLATEQETSRRKKIIEARKLAESLGSTDFIAPCKTHGMTEYTVIHNTSRCVACQDELLTKRNIKDRDDSVDPALFCEKLIAERKRIQEIKAARKAAIAENKDTFTGPCATHGLTEYRIVHGSSRCVNCRRDQAINQHHKRNMLGPKDPDPNLEPDLKRKAIVRAARVKAIKAGLTEFEAECRKHGKTTFFLNDQNLSRCRSCYKEYSRSRHERNMATKKQAKELEKKQLPVSAPITEHKLSETARLGILREARKKADVSGETEFTAICANHGKTNYVIKSGVSRCVQCLKIQHEKRKSQKWVGGPEEIKRKEDNRKALEDAVAKGERYFIATCKSHNLSPHTADPRVKNGVIAFYECRCLECKGFSKFKTELVRKTKADMEKDAQQAA